MALRLTPRLALRAPLTRSIPTTYPTLSPASLALRAIRPAQGYYSTSPRVGVAVANLGLRRFSSAAPVARPAPSSSAPSPSQSQTTSSAEDSSSSSSEPPEPEPKSAYARFKALTKKYGSWAIGMYFFLSTIDFTLTFLLVHSLGAERIEPVVDKAKGWYRTQRYGEEEAARRGEVDRKERREKKEEAEREEREGRKKEKGWAERMGPAFWAEVAVAYTIHKTALLPLRAGFTVAWTPKLVEWLTKRGWVGKGGLTRAATHAGGKVRTASDRMKDRVKREA
ncbi:hypothetical protein IAT38_008371 [Cryptococcus sp. DSM 104549]